MDKNFGKLEEGCWYQRRDGALAQVTKDNDGCYYAASIEYFIDGRREVPGPNRQDLVLKVEPLTIVPCKQKKKIKKWQWILKDEQGFYAFSTSRYTEAPTIKGFTSIEPYLPSEIEVEE